MTDELYYQIALTMINGVGGILSRQLLSSFGDAQSIFKEKKQKLEKKLYMILLILSNAG